MGWQYHPLLVLFALGGFVSVGVAGYSWRYMRTYGPSYLVGSIGLLGFHNAIWVFAAMLKTASVGLEDTLFFYKLEFLGILPITAVILVVALAYVGKDPWLTRRTVVGLGVVPTALLVLVLANPDNVMIVNPRLVRAQGIMTFEHDFTPLFTVYLAWLLGTALIAILILAWGLLADRVPAAPTQAAITALLLPYIAGVSELVGIYPANGEGINLTPAMGAMGIVVLAAAIIHYRVFDLVPVGRDQAIEVMDDGYLLINTDGTVLDANPAAAQLLVGDSGRDLRNEPITEFLPVYGDLTETSSIDLETENQVVEVRCSKVTRQDQNAGEVLLLQDVTEKREQQRELERRNERLDQFASTVSHDLRNPLNVAQLRLDLAQAETESEHLVDVQNAHERMEALVNELLVLARQGETIEELEPVDLAALTETTWQTVDTAEATLVTETEQTVLADSSRVQQLLENLFKNAVKHGDASVDVTVDDLDDGFSVADDGSGIPPDEREDVFSMGYSTADDGTGFGLNIVQDIVETHGWDITVTESEDGGARFEITGIEIVE